MRQAAARSEYLSAVRENADGYDEVKLERRASHKRHLGVKFAEYVESLNEIARRERLERDGGELFESPPILKGADRGARRPNPA